MTITYTDGRDSDFIKLCVLLDDYLNEAAGGIENRREYIPYNVLDDIHDAFVAYSGTEPVGCAAFKYYSSSTAEVKRVFVKQEHRGQGVSKRIMEALEEKAREQGYTKLILETGKPLTEANGLYRSLGYGIIENYGQYKGMEDSVCMEKEL
ncbi:GNAT family N-acetyltransferase [Breznakiella homolactica]|uniref:GNAT family N-acetyltransferase n=1 Tax=Breznakiella homolactica TaxID=2798577 RepID=A0A7T7XPV9_9SPIR|nr:GNAT family N-acetyltransferase [Breznakiella homolactica]QQO10269.1 GNAT family N-acetyltransferase [Breznakiella homolactica]